MSNSKFLNDFDFDKKADCQDVNYESFFSAKNWSDTDNTDKSISSKIDELYSKNPTAVLGIIGFCGIVLASYLLSVRILSQAIFKGNVKTMKYMYKLYK